MSKIKITLDPGHKKDYNRGAVSPYCEGNGMFDLALYLKDALERTGIFSVELTKTKVEDLPSLYNRGRMAVTNGSRLFLSLHSNGANGKAYGVSEFISLYRDSAKFATGLGDVVTALFKEFGSSKTYNRGAKTRKGSNGDYYGVIRSAVSSVGVQHVVLVEHGFHDYVEECKCLNQTKFLEALAEREAKYIYDQLKQYYCADSVPIYKATITTKLNIRSGPTTKDTILGYYPAGSIAPVISVDNGWARVKYNGAIAFASTSYMKLPSGVPSYAKVKNPLPSIETSEVPKPAPIDRARNVEILINALRREFKSTIGIAGLLGNLYAESGLIPTNLQNTYETKLGFTDESYTDAVDSGKYTKFVTDGAGYGLAQWTHYSRKEKLLKWAKEQKLSIGNMTVQASFLIKELKESFPEVYNAINNATDIEAATLEVLLKFEKPASMNSASTQARRCEYARMMYNEYFMPIDDEHLNRLLDFGTATTTAVLNVRTGPGTKYPSLGTFKKGAYLLVYKDATCANTNWYRVYYGTLNGINIADTSTIGYVCGDYLTLEELGDAVFAMTTANLNVRTGPGTNYPKITMLKPGEKVYALPNVTGAPSNWVQILEADLYDRLMRGKTTKADTANLLPKYVNRNYLMECSAPTISGNEEAALETHKMPYGVGIITKDATIYSTPTKDSPVGVYDNGTSVVLTGHMANGYEQIRFGSNIGYVETSYVEIKNDIGTTFESLNLDDLPDVTPEMKEMAQSLPEITAMEWFKTTLKILDTQIEVIKYASDNKLLATANGGTPVYAITDGICIENGHDCDGWGNYVAILSIDGYLHIYAHLKSAGIPEVGDLIWTAQKIGYVGATGAVTKNTLEYQILDADGCSIYVEDYSYPKSMGWKNITA